MPRIQWNDGLSVNVGEADRQHQKLIAMINDLDDAMRQGKGKDVVGPTITGLVDYTRTHFAMEERYFDQFGYPEASDHKKKHSDFVQRLADFKDKFAAGKLLLSMELMDFLSHWLQTHIKTVDKGYGPFLNAKGVR